MKFVYHQKRVRLGQSKIHLEAQFFETCNDILWGIFGDRDAVRTPTPPSVFDDQPPTFDGPPRPVLSPMDVLEFKNALAEDAANGQRLLVKPKVRAVEAGVLSILN